MRQFSTNVCCEPHCDREGKKTYLCPSTDRVRFRLFPSTVWAGREYGLDWFRVRFCYPRRWKRVREPHAKQYRSIQIDNSRKNPHAHKIKLALLPPPSKKPRTPPLKGGILWAWRFSPAERTQKCQAPIKLAQPFPAQNCGQKFYGHHAFSETGRNFFWGN